MLSGSEQASSLLSVLSVWIMGGSFFVQAFREAESLEVVEIGPSLEVEELASLQAVVETLEVEDLASLQTVVVVVEFGLELCVEVLLDV